MEIARQEVVEATPCLFLVALDGDELKRVTGRAGAAAGVARLWLLVAWIPDDSKVKGYLCTYNSLAAFGVWIVALPSRGFRF